MSSLRNTKQDTDSFRPQCSTSANRFLCRLWVLMENRCCLTGHFGWWWINGWIWLHSKGCVGSLAHICFLCQIKFIPCKKKKNQLFGLDLSLLLQLFSVQYLTGKWWQVWQIMWGIFDWNDFHRCYLTLYLPQSILVNSVFSQRAVEKQLGLISRAFVGWLIYFIKMNYFLVRKATVKLLIVFIYLVCLFGANGLCFRHLF